jgi:selenium metabolism protein YedF
MTTTVDARGLACPQPVILARRALREGSDVVVIVDNEVARHNVARMAEKSGHAVRVEQDQEGIRVYIAAEDELTELAPVGEPECAVDPSLVLFVSSEYMGRGEHSELGHILMRGFFHTLGEVEPVPGTAIFINSGVKLVAEGSPVLEDLHELANAGVEILACGTCLSYYELEDKLAVGAISNMYTIAETLLGAEKTVQL